MNHDTMHHDTHTTARIGEKVMWTIALIATLGTSSPAVARPRDVDGSRMQARHCSVGDTLEDSLNPPRDRVDWRSFRVTDAKTVRVSLSHKPAKGRAVLTLVSSSGGELGRTTTRAGKASLSQALKPGVYYIAVSSGEKLEYSLSLK